MFTGEYSHSNSYFQFEVAGELPGEGVLKGNEGELRFRRVQDGLAVYDSTLRTTGMAYPGSPDDICVPGTINDIPVTELHQSVCLRSRSQLAIEHKNLKRVYLSFGRSTPEEQMKSTDNGLGTLIQYMLREQEGINQNPSDIRVDIRFCGSQQIEFCSIECAEKLVLSVPDVIALEVRAPKTLLRGGIPEHMEHIKFSGKVYPYVVEDWDPYEDNRCFEGAKALKTVDGSLSGKNGWSFSGCTALRSVHLSDGIEKIPDYAFQNCLSLTDLYIPDTVTEIGDYAFSGCEKLAGIHLPNGLKKISKGMFNGCKTLKKVFLPDTIEVIDDYAFAGCTNLRKPWIPGQIQSISDTAFSPEKQ